MENNQIIEAEYREVNTDMELQTITTEIKLIAEQMNRTVLQGIIEIGRRFDRAKSLVQYGKWGEWCEKCTGYKQSMAENYIKAYQEYGSEQYSLFGDLSESQSIGNLGITKLIELTAIPADEREAFVEENNITEETTVRELHELIQKQKNEIEESEKRSEQQKAELKNQLDIAEQEAADKQNEIDRLKAELERRKNEPPVIPQDELERMMAEQDSQAKETLQKEINRLEAEIQKSEDKAEKLKQKYDKLTKKNNQTEIELEQTKNSLSDAQSKNDELVSEISRLKKEAELGSNKNMVKLNMCFEAAQTSISQVIGALEAIKDSGEYKKLHNAIYQTLRHLLEE